MGAVLIPVVIVLVAFVAAVAATKRFAKARKVRADEIRAHGKVLRYQVPNGLDASDVVLWLDRNGYEAVPDGTVGQPGEILIGRRGGKSPDREEVRRLLVRMSATYPAGVAAPARLDDVRFMDE